MIEKVNPAHPDKIADRIAGALVDYAYSVQSNPRIAVEALIGHRVCHIIAETSVHIPATFVQDTVTRIAGEGVVMDLLTEFRDEDWISMVDHVTVHAKGDIWVTFRDGSEIKAGTSNG